MQKYSHHFKYICIWFSKMIYNYLNFLCIWGHFIYNFVYFLILLYFCNMLASDFFKRLSSYLFISIPIYKKIMMFLLFSNILTSNYSLLSFSLTFCYSFWNYISDNVVQLAFFPSFLLLSPFFSFLFCWFVHSLVHFFFFLL